MQYVSDSVLYNKATVCTTVFILIIRQKLGVEGSFMIGQYSKRRGLNSLRGTLAALAARGIDTSQFPSWTWEYHHKTAQKQLYCMAGWISVKNSMKVASVLTFFL